MKLIELFKGAAGVRGVPDGSGPEGKGPTGRQRGNCPKRKDFSSSKDYIKALRKWRKGLKKSFVLKRPSEIVLEKGKKFSDGTIRDWGGKKYKKVAGKWVPYGGGGNKDGGGSEKTSKPVFTSSSQKQSGPAKFILYKVFNEGKKWSDYSVAIDMDQSKWVVFEGKVPKSNRYKPFDLPPPNYVVKFGRGNSYIRVFKTERGAKEFVNKRGGKYIKFSGKKEGK